MSTVTRPQPLCPLLGRCAWLFAEKSTWKCVISSYSLWAKHSLSLPMPPPHSPCDTQQIACKAARISLCTLIIICIQTGLTGWGRRKRQQGERNHNLLSLLFIMWLAWSTVPLAPIPFPRLRHTGSIAQLTKWPLNHVIMLSVYHWQKEANLITHFSRSPKAKYNGNLMKCIKCPYILRSHIKATVE